MAGIGADTGKRTDALEAGLRALRRRDLSAGQLRERLLSRAFTASQCEDALATLARTGLLDDERFA